MTLFASYRTEMQQLESSILNIMSVGWQPSSGFNRSGNITFNIKQDLNRIPTRTYAFTHLDDCLIPIFIYLLLLFIGHIIFSFRNKNAKPLISNSILYYFKFLYNLCQIFLCGYMSLESLILANRNNYYLMPFTKSQCNKFNFSQPVIHKVLWLFYVSKIFDFFDTLFIILGNKRSQFTFLHQYHHITIYLINWINVNITYDGSVFLTVLLNAFIHTIMYLYYLISMHIPKVINNKTKRNKYSVWWKKYLTFFQMIQFLCMNVQAILILANGCKEMPPRVIWLYLIYIISLFAMFMNFFKKSYGNKRDKKKRKSN